VKRLTLVSLFFGILFSTLANSPIPIELIQNTKKVSLVFVGSKDGISESSFGHIALRFSPNDQLSIFDTNIQFVAKMDEQESALKKYTKGLGVFGNYAYDVTVEIEPFINYQLTKTKLEKRDVYVYPLDLTQEQISNLVNYIENFFSQENAAKYRFFNRNCSFFAADALEVATNSDFKVKSQPWRLENELRKHDLISQEVFHPSMSTLKNNLVEELFNSELNENLLKMTSQRDFQKNISSDDEIQKKHAYLQLLSLAFQSPYVLHDSELKELAISYYTKLYATESSNETLYYRALLNSTDDTSLIHTTTTLSSDEEPRSLSQFTHSLYVAKNRPTLKIKWRSEQGFTHKRLHMNFLDYGQSDNQIYYKGQKVGSALFSRKEDWISATHLNYSISLKDKKINTIFHMSSAHASTKNPSILENSESILAINNMTDFDKGYAGACYAMVKIQKALLDRARFAPEQSIHQSIDKIKLIDQVYRGQYVVIPGFANINEFSASIDKEELKEYLVKIEHEINGNAVQSFKEGLFERQKVDRKGIKNLQSLLHSGHLTELIIGMTQKGSKRYEPVSHVVLATDIEENTERGGWNIRVYDPNLGYYNAYMGTDYKMELSKFYRKDLDYHGVLNVINRDEIDIELGIRSLQLDDEKLQKRASRGAPLFYNPLKYIQ